MSTVIGRMHVIQTDLPFGRLVVLAQRWCSGTVTIHLLDQNEQPADKFYAELRAHKDDAGNDIKAAGFPLLPPGNYKVIQPGYTYSGRNVTVFPGVTAEVDFR